MEHLTSPLLVVGCITVAGYYIGKTMKLIKLPSIIGYMIIGVLLGPSIVEFISEKLLIDLGFINQIALGFVAFTIGSELSLKALKKLGKGIIAIIFAESLCAFGVVFGAVYALTRDLPMSLIFASMAPASAPAGTVAVIQEFKAKGSLTTALYAVVGFDDGLAIFIFGFSFAVAKSLLDTSGGGSIGEVLLVPAKEILFSILVGGVLGFLFCNLVRRITNTREMFILSFGFILIASGLSEMWHLSLILTNLVIGFVMVNTRNQELVHKVGDQMGQVMPLIFILFFALAGSHLNLSVLPSLGAIGIVYIISRSAGLILGARVGATIGHVEEKIKKYIGLGILSQAGVAIGLSLIVMEEFSRLKNPHAAEIGSIVITSITATCIFFEVIGPIMTKVALEKAGEINAENK
jgi:Kef-type K+ transport system membrane component KefB